MGAFENATKFFEACENAQGWEGCKPYVVPGAPFRAQSEPLTDVTTKVWNASWALRELGWM